MQIQDINYSQTIHFICGKQVNKYDYGVYDDNEIYLFNTLVGVQPKKKRRINRISGAGASALGRFRISNRICPFNNAQLKSVWKNYFEIFLEIMVKRGGISAFKKFTQNQTGENNLC